MVQSGTLVQPTLDNTLGALFLGVVFGALLFGINILQSYFYFHEFQNDSRLHRSSVLVLCLLDAFNLSLAIHAVYTYLITGSGNALALTAITWSVKLQVSVNVVVILIVHCLYTTRVCLLGGYHRSVLSYFVVLVVVIGFVLGVLFAYFICTIHTYPELSKVSWIIDAATAMSTFVDFVISAAMCYYLRKSTGQMRELNSKISNIIQYTLACGLLTSACSLCTLFSYVLLPHTFIFAAFQFLLPKLYVGSYLALLNARKRNGNGHKSFGGSVSVEIWHTKESHTRSDVWRPQTMSTMTTEMPTLSHSEAERKKPDVEC